VKTERDFPEILAADNPDIWRTNRPVEGGETGAMLRSIIEEAAKLKAARTEPEKVKGQRSKVKGKSKGKKQK